MNLEAVHLPIKMIGNLKCSSGKLLSPLVAQNKDVGTALQTLLTKVKLHLQRLFLHYFFSHLFFFIFALTHSALSILILFNDYFLCSREFVHA